ncbi:helix-turn-helix domain-containing protein [Proteus sp. G2672]|uniref:helix-turn-helix domain-containing protein n=1 Tax=Proteus sp. G2672 TaxID=2698884 RepID=UPI001377AED3|nr:helix-turn-helix transcriptional regulator [Proteus sp. G2672]NBL77955.1 helix-turn-helix domain-containing protein [Proteus sp. G2672]
MSINEAVLNECQKAKLLVKMYEFSKENGELDPNEDALSVRMLSETIESIVSAVERNYQPDVSVSTRPITDNYYQQSCSTFAERLKLVLRESGITQTALAKCMGVSQSLISSLVTGKRNGVEYSSAISSALGINKWWLAYGEGEMTDFCTSKTEEL